MKERERERERERHLHYTFQFDIFCEYISAKHTLKIWTTLFQNKKKQEHKNIVAKLTSNDIIAGMAEFYFKLFFAWLSIIT